MRDIIIALMVFASVPVTLTQPYVGVLMWSWIGFMNPHRLTFGFAYDYPFAAIVGGATLLGVVFKREFKNLPMTPVVWMLILFSLWMCVATLFALFPEFAIPKWSRTMKIMLFTLVTIMAITREDRLHWLLWVTVVSIGFYGAKGGYFAVTHPLGGRELVYGPPGSFIEENNALALALIMTLPLMRYLQLVTENKWLKRGLLGVMLLCVASIVGSYSRGALVAGTAMGLFMWAKSDNRLRIGLVLAVVATVLVFVVPSNWVDRMETIRSYDRDSSALGRINAWSMAFHLSNDRPLVGGGFSTFQDEAFQKYAPEPTDVHDAHSIYFEVLGEQGYVGLILFVLFGVLAFRTGSWIIRHTRDRPDLHRPRHLAAMLQASLIGYATGGAFLGVAYFDLFYHLVAMLVVTRVLVEKALQQQPGETRAASVADTPRLSREYS